MFCWRSHLPDPSPSFSEAHIDVSLEHISKTHCSFLDSRPMQKGTLVRRPGPRSSRTNVRDACHSFCLFRF